MRAVLIFMLLIAVSCSGNSPRERNGRADSTDNVVGFDRLKKSFTIGENLSVFKPQSTSIHPTPAVVSNKIINDLKKKIRAEYPTDSEAIFDNIASSEEVILWNLGTIENATVYLFHFREIALGERYWLYLFKEGKISATPFTFSSETLDSSQLSTKHFPVLSLEKGSKEMRVFVRHRNGNLYEAIISYCLKFDSALNISQDLKVELKSLVPFDNSGSRIERQIEKQSSSDSYLLSVFLKKPNAGKVLIGKVGLQKKLGKWVVLHREILDNGFKDLLITCSPNGEERFLMEGAAF